MKKMIIILVSVSAIVPVFALGRIAGSLSILARKSDVIAVVEVEKTPVQAKLESLDATNRLTFLRSLTPLEKEELLRVPYFLILRGTEEDAFRAGLTLSEMETAITNLSLRPGQEHIAKATARVLEPVLGVATGSVFALEFGGTDDAFYTGGETCLLFVAKMTNGNYHTSLGSGGKFRVKDKTVTDWFYKGSVFVEDHPRYTHLTNVLDQVREVLRDRQHKGKP